MIDAPNIQWKQGTGYVAQDIGTDAMARKVLVEAVPDNIIASEGFEGGVAGSGTWTITTSNPHSGINCLRSAVIGNNAQTNQVFNIPPGATHLRFWHRVSSEQNFDFFRVLVDAVQVFQLSGTANLWQQLTIPLGAATTVTFRYIKDSSDTAGLDAAFIDDLEWIIPGVAAVEVHEPLHLDVNNRLLVALDEPIETSNVLPYAALTDDTTPLVFTGPGVIIDSFFRSYSLVVTKGTVTINGIPVKKGFSLRRAADPGKTVPGFAFDATGGELIFDSLREV